LLSTNNPGERRRGKTSDSAVKEKSSCSREIGKDDDEKKERRSRGREG
jgi:hypothetical protein